MLLFKSRTNQLLYPISKKFLSTVTTEKVINPVLNEIVQRIKINGPISVADYMKIVLTAPRDGFYMKQDVFGTKGHFTTSPEITQIFGELLAVWLISEWQRVGCPKPFRIIELGPGRGTLASDISRVVSRVSLTRHETSLHLVEVSPYLTQVQKQRLSSQPSEKPFVVSKDDIPVSWYRENEQKPLFVSKDGIPVSWYRDIEQIPNASSGFDAFVANEFFDALPVHKFQKNEKGIWNEIMIDSDPESKLKFIITPRETPASKVYIKNPGEGVRHMEVCPEAGVICSKIVERMNQLQNGCFLISDYGFDDSECLDRDTFRAYHQHEQCHPLSEPGDADLTADVDFQFLKSQVREKALIYGPVNQRDFLIQVGIGLRLKKLLECTKSEEEKTNLKSGVDKIINEMGQRFKFLSIFPLSNKEFFENNPPAGFSEQSNAIIEPHT